MLIWYKNCLFEFERVYSFLVPDLFTALCSGTSLTCKGPLRSHQFGIQTELRPLKSTPIRRDGLNRVLQEHYIVHRALTRWEGPRHASFATFRARLSFISTWPREGKPSFEALSAAGFFYVGNYLIICYRRQRSSYVWSSQHSIARHELVST